MFGNADANGRRTKKLKHCWTRRSFDSGIRKVWDTCRPWQGTFKIQAVASHTHTKSPIRVAFLSFFPAANCQSVVRSGRSKRFHEQNWFECLCFTALLEDAHDLYILDHGANGCIKSIHLKAVWNRLASRWRHAKIMKDISAVMKWHMSSHDWCAWKILWYTPCIYIYRYIFHRHRHHIGSHECYCSSFHACWDVQLSIRIKEKLDHVHLAQWQGPFCCGYIGQQETRRMKKPH